MREGRTGSGGARTRARNVLVVGEVAIALVLLVGAALFMRSFLKLQGANAGFETAPLMTMRVYLPGDGYAEPGAKARRLEDILARMERVPGVRAAAASNLIPLDGGGERGPVVVDGAPVEPGQEQRVFHAGVTRRFFETLDVPLVRGRGFTASDEERGSAVALVNVSFVRRVFAASDAARTDAPGNGCWARRTSDAWIPRPANQAARSRRGAVAHHRWRRARLPDHRDG
jgi:hypothetical protein